MYSGKKTSQDVDYVVRIECSPIILLHIGYNVNHLFTALTLKGVALMGVKDRNQNTNQLQYMYIDHITNYY